MADDPAILFADLSVSDLEGDLCYPPYYPDAGHEDYWRGGHTLYVVVRGHQEGLYTTWKSTEQQVKKYKDAMHHSFSTYALACSYWNSACESGDVKTDHVCDPNGDLREGAPLRTLPPPPKRAKSAAVNPTSTSKTAVPAPSKCASQVKPILPPSSSSLSPPTEPVTSTNFAAPTTEKNRQATNSSPTKKMFYALQTAGSPVKKLYRRLDRVEAEWDNLEEGGEDVDVSAAHSLQDLI